MEVVIEIKDFNKTISIMVLWNHKNAGYDGYLRNVAIHFMQL